MHPHTSGKTRRDWLAFDRSDYIGARIIFGIAMAGSVLVGLGGPVVAAATHAPLSLSYTSKVTSGIVLPRGATHDGYTTIDVLLLDATPAERLGQALPGVVLAAVTFTVAWMFFQLLRSTRAGEPFTKANVWRLHVAALTVGIGGTLAQVAQGFADSAIYTSGRLPDAAGLSFEMIFTPVPLVVMLAIALVAEAFGRGVALRDDVEGLV